MRGLTLVLWCLVGGACLAAPQLGRQQEVANAFSNRKVVEAMVDCFLDKKPCTAEEARIKRRAFATMRNFGTCPKNICSPAEQEEMEQSMELLRTKYPDLWLNLILSMFGVDLSGLFGRNRN